MNGTYKPGGNMNLSGTQGLGLDMEPWAYEARGRNSGLRQGRREGYEEGHSEGHSDGFDDGFWDGLRAGRNQAWNEANTLIGKERERANQLVVYIVAMRHALETLIEKNPNAARYIRKLIKESYEYESSKSITAGELLVPPHESPEFYNYSPDMRRFVLQVLP